MSDLILSIDGMGGDNAPISVVDGMDIASKKHKNISFLVYGDKQILAPLLEQKKYLKDKYEIIHTNKVISSGDKPSTALRNGKESSMRLAVEAVKKKEAIAVISAGNTGALMAISKLVLRTMEDIERPAIVALYPTVTGNPCVVLDSGANVDCSSEILFQFALMGDAFSKAITGLHFPKIGLLNIGSEDVKGNDTVKRAYQMLKESDLPINFYGFIEGNDICMGTVDVVVTDGFTGNIALKTAEGTAKMFGILLKQAFKKNLLSKLGYLLAKSAFKDMYKSLDTRTYSGGMFAGLNGISVKSHGSSDGVAFANTIELATSLAEYDINKKILEEIHLKQNK